MMAQTLFPVEIAEIRREAEAVISLTLVPTGKADLPSWTPGAHIDLHLPSGLVRKYSLCSDPSDRRAWRIAVLRAGDGGGSAEIHDRLRPGDHLPVGGPHNHFPLVPADSYLFIAGGIGVTPFLPMIRAAKAAGRGWRLVYIGRRRPGWPVSMTSPRWAPPPGSWQPRTPAAPTSPRCWRGWPRASTPIAAAPTR